MDRGSSSPDDGGSVVERLSADEAFDLLGDETRLGILRALFDGNEPLAFSELREAVGTSDSGRFNYHLDKVRGTFVESTEEGYDLTPAGSHVVGAILAGRYTATVESDPVPVDATCAICGAALLGVFDEGFGTVRCPACDRAIIRLTVPAGIFHEYPREEWPAVAERWTRRQFETIQDGFCSICHGPTRGRLETDVRGISDVFEAGVHYECERCGQSHFANVEASVLSHPAVVTFHHEHGIDVGGTPIWELDWAVQPLAAVVSRDPPRVEVPIELDDERMVLTLDEDATVIDERRESGSGADLNPV